MTQVNPPPTDDALEVELAAIQTRIKELLAKQAEGKVSAEEHAELTAKYAESEKLQKWAFTAKNTAQIARNHIYRKVGIKLGQPDTPTTPEEIDAYLEKNGITIKLEVVSPEPPPEPTPLPTRPSLRLAFLSEPTALPASITALLADLDAWLADPTHYPNVSRLPDTTHPEVDGGKRKLLTIKQNRALQTAYTLEFFRYIHAPSLAVARRVAEFVMVLKDGLVDRSLKDPLTGDYAPEYYDTIKDVQRRNPKMTANYIDQEGILRQIYENGQLNAGFRFTDLIPLERALTDGTRVEMALFLKDHLGLDPVIDAAYSFLMDLIRQTEERTAFLATHAAGKDPLFGYGQSLRHSTLALGSALTGMWELTGEARYSTAAEQVWDWFFEDWSEFKLPDGRMGRAGTHQIAGYAMYLYGNTVPKTFHNSVYLEETMARLGVRALIGNTPVTLQDFIRATNMLYHTLPRFGWTETAAAPKPGALGWIAGDMGGGGRNLPSTDRFKAFFTDGSTVPSPYRVSGMNSEGEVDHDLFLSLVRGPTMLGAAYTSIPGFEAKLREAQRVNMQRTPERGALKTALMLYDFKHASMLRTAL